MSDERKTVVSVKNVAKDFKIPIDKSSGIKQLIVNILKRRKGYRNLHALRDISFEVKEGDFFGIVGRNGSGKSTLLKLIAQIYTPDKGSIKVNGSLVPFIELGVGFNPELSGRENIYLNGALLGFSREEIDDMYNDIVDFAELGDFMEERLKNYSSGMQVRLAFSIAIRARGDILLLDEVLAVGDEAFQRKCFNYFAKLKREKKTVILVTHNMDSVQHFCTSAIMIENGKITAQGKTGDVAQAYRELFMNDKQKAIKASKAVSNDNISISIDYKNNGDKLIFSTTVSPKISVEDAVFSFVIVRDNGEWVYRWVSDEKVEKNISLDKGKPKIVTIEIENIFPDGIFDINFGVKNRDRSKQYASFAAVKQFEIISTGKHTNRDSWKPKDTSHVESIK